MTRAGSIFLREKERERERGVPLFFTNLIVILEKGTSRKSRNVSSKNFPQIMS